MRFFFALTFLCFSSLVHAQINPDFLITKNAGVIYVGRGEAYDWNGWTSECDLRVQWEETANFLIFHHLQMDCGSISKKSRSLRLQKIGNTLINEQGADVGTWGETWAQFQIQSSYQVTEQIKIQKRFGYAEYREDWVSETDGEWYFTLTGEMSPLLSDK